MPDKKYSSAQGAQGKAGPGSKSKDAPAAVTEIQDGSDARQKTTNRIAESHPEESDRQPTERGDVDPVQASGARR
jgi:hypothetical protein